MKRILVTGASRGIGRAIACTLAAPGVALFLHGRDRGALSETAECVRGRGSEASILAHDLTDKAQLVLLAKEMGTEPLHALIHNAGIAVVKPVESITYAEWQRSFDVNVTAPFVLSQSLIPNLQDGGSIVHILSVAAKTTFPHWSAYCMSKFALEGFSRSLREELRPKGIRVINVYPAATHTSLWEAVEGTWPEDKMLPPEEIAEAVRYVLSRPESIALEELHLAGMAGRLEPVKTPDE